ncbi:hypothetical protein CSPX01_07573 [Colletotrichum filicis]|nr:hypothetical protein CSPX01_07573 [Colletotrichum filicis]
MEKALAEAKTQASMSASVPELTFSAKISRLHERFQSLDLYKPHDLRNGLHFSRYYIRTGKDELAKALVGDLLKQTLKMMFNNDPTDDHACYWQLQMIFTTFEDDANALAAWNMMAISKKDSYDEYFRKLGRWRKKVARWEAARLSKVGEKSEGGNLLVPCSTEDESLTEIEVSEDESSKPTEPTVGFGVHCHGCNYKWKYPSVIYTCADDCGRVQFDKSCYKKLKAGTLGNDFCDKDHKFLEVPKQDMRQGLDLPLGSVMVGGRRITLEVWREEIKSKYLDHGETQ